MNAFYTANEILALGGWIAPGYQTVFTLHPRLVAAGTAPTLYSDGADYGDDMVSYASPSTVMGWIAGAAATELEVNEAQVVAPEIARAFLPLGTPLAAGDEVGVLGSTYTVVGTTSDRTFAVFLVANLRKLV